MTTPHLRKRAEQAGIETSLEGIDGVVGDVPAETLERFLSLLDEAPRAAKQGTLQPCHIPAWLAEKPAWGIAAQLYELRSARNWGIGDFADLQVICRIAGSLGADFVGLNPLHAPFFADAARCSPFSPSNRRFLNPLYIAVDRVNGYRLDEAQSGAIQKARAASHVDYPAVARLKLGALRRVWTETQAGKDGAFSAFLDNGGGALQRHALFEALSEHFVSEGNGAGWHGWPSAFQDCRSKAVADFAETRTDAVAFHAWLQFLASRQLDEVRSDARAAGLRIGLYLDFAVGDAPDGSATWSEPDLVMRGVTIGAPPDVFSEQGQDWGLAPLAPHRLAGAGGEAYAGLVDAAMHKAGALRVDHAMALRRMFWVPEGQTPAEGAFVRYPMADMVAMLAQASHRHGTVVIGEDLGHVPDGFRDQMGQAQILSYRILYFEQKRGHFLPAARWPRLALACLSTHDLPTLAGWRQGNDAALRVEHGLIDRASGAKLRRRRRVERARLVQAMNAEGVMPELPDGAAEDVLLGALNVAAHRFIASTPCLLAAARLADLVGERHPTNLPGTSASYPNWQRKLDVPVEDLAHHPLFRMVTSAMAKERPR